MIQRIKYCSTEPEFKDAFSSFTGDCRRIMVVHGHGSYVSCGAKDLIDLVSQGLTLVEFDDFSANPKQEDAQAGTHLLAESNPDMIVAVGGGSVIDMAKLIRHYSQCEIPLLAIPTTAGTGAESTQFAVCYIEGIKHSISDPSILPDMVLLYPPLTYGNSPYLTACTGFDALAQAIEAYWNVNATPESDALALRAIERIYPRLISEPTPDNRMMLLLGANDAGRAINITRTTVPHALSYTLTSKYGYPPGHAVALTFPFFFKYNLEGDEASYKGNDYKDYAAKMERLCTLMEVTCDPFLFMKNYLQQIGLTFDPRRDFDDCIVADGINLERAKNTPIAINRDVIMNAVKSIRE